VAKRYHQRTAIITGITGQDGRFLADLLLKRGYQVHGMIMSMLSESDEKYFRLLPQGERLEFHTFDLELPGDLKELLDYIQPDEIYHLAAQSHVPTSFEHPERTMQINAEGTLRLLEAAHQFSAIQQPVRFFHASTCAILKPHPTESLTENSPRHPTSPYAESKLRAHEFVEQFRNEQGLFACNGILFNHESPLRTNSFVTRKITQSAARIKLGLQDKLILGNLDAERDWGYAGDYVEAMRLMLQQNQPDDYILSTGVTHTVQEFVELAFQEVELDWQPYVEIDEQFLRTTDAPRFCGDATKIKKACNWKPQVSFEGLVRMMMKSDLKLARKEKREKKS